MLAYEKMKELQPENSLYYTHDDIGYGYLFADYCKWLARYNMEAGYWMVYDGKVWTPDVKEIYVSQLAKEVVEEMLEYGSGLFDETVRNEFTGWIKKLGNRRKRETMILDARSVHPVKQADFDTDPWLFNMNNCTLDLRTYEVHDHRSLDMLTKISPVDYDGSARSERFERFIDEIMCGDEDLKTYLQKAIGYGISGDTSLECLFLLYGKTTRNGKGTLVETLLKALGDYGETADPDLLSAKTFSAGPGGHSEGVARLAGKHFVNMSEPPKSMMFNAALVKRLSGNDSIVCRYLHRNSFVYKPQFKIFINTNYLPNVNDNTLFTSGRIVVIPFNRHFEPEEQDRNLKNILADEENLKGVLNWCLIGCRQYLREGLEQPRACLDALEEYRNETDRIYQFCKGWLVHDATSNIKYMYIYNCYKDWCLKHRFSPENSRNFKAGLQRYFEVAQDVRPSGGGNPTSVVLHCAMNSMEKPDDEESEEFDEQLYGGFNKLSFA